MSILITDQNLKALIEQLSAFERRCLARHLKGVGDSVGADVFRRIKSGLKRRARAGRGTR